MMVVVRSPEILASGIPMLVKFCGENMLLLMCLWILVIVLGPSSQWSSCPPGLRGVVSIGAIM